KLAFRGRSPPSCGMHWQCLQWAAADSRLTELSWPSAVPLTSAPAGRASHRSRRPLFDPLACAGWEGLRQCTASFAGSDLVDLDWNVAWFCPAPNLVGIIGGPAEEARIVGPIEH